MLGLAQNWMSVFDRWDNLKHFQREAIVSDLGHYNRGPIAEVYKWDSNYYNRESNRFCPECSWFAWSYSYVITGGDNMSLDREILELKNHQFCDHWSSNHVKKTRRAHK